MEVNGPVCVQVVADPHNHEGVLCFHPFRWERMEAIPVSSLVSSPELMTGQNLLSPFRHDERGRDPPIWLDDHGQRLGAEATCVRRAGTPTAGPSRRVAAKRGGT